MKSHNESLEINGTFNSSSNFTSCRYHNCLDYYDYVDFIENYIEPLWYEWVFIVMHLLVFIVGIVGNLLVCVSVYRNRSMRTVTNYFIVNLAAADCLVLLICLPPTVLWDVTETWFFGDISCKLTIYFQNVSVCVSVLTLGAISMDRWYAICNPLKFKGTASQAKVVIVIIWLISLAVSFPHLVWLQTKKNINLDNFVYLTDCRYLWGEMGDYINQTITVVIFYIIPLTMMSVAYYQIARVLWTDNLPGSPSITTPTMSPIRRYQGSSQRLTSMCNLRTARGHEGQVKTRRKAAKMLIAVVILFAFCFLPVHLLSILRILINLPQTNAITIISLLSHWLSYFNSAANPIIYTFMSGKFRKEFHRVARCVFTWKCVHHKTVHRLRKTNIRCHNLNMHPFSGFEPRTALEDNPSPRY